MSLWLQQLIFLVLPAVIAEVLFHRAIEGTVLRVLTVAVLATAVATIAALLLVHGDALTVKGSTVSLGIAAAVALLTSWVGSLRGK
jgi:hypothetical protein